MDIDVDTIEFFASRNIAIPRLIDRKPRDITVEMVEKACISVRKNHEGIKPISLAREVWRRAKLLKDNSYKEEKIIKVAEEKAKVAEEKAKEDAAALLNLKLTESKNENERLKFYVIWLIATQIAYYIMWG